jgi:hypothetical protein
VVQGIMGEKKEKEIEKCLMKREGKRDKRERGEKKGKRERKG